MPIDLKWELGVLFDAHDDEMAKAIIVGICEGIVQANMVWMERIGLRNVPCCLGDVGVVYIDPIGCSDTQPCQKVLTGPEILRRKRATCIDIACYMVALLRLLYGRPAEVLIANMIDYDDRPIEGQYHVVTGLGNGQVHDYTEDLINGDLAQCSADCAGA